MVVDYLEKIREYLQNEKINLSSEIQEYRNRLKENTEIKKVLEENTDPYFEAFTPRQVNGFNKRKIEELGGENLEMENKIIILQDKLSSIENELEKLNTVIKSAKEKDVLLNKLGY